LGKKIIEHLKVSPLPEPVVLVTAKAADKEPNIITVAWTGFMSFKPPTVYIAIHPLRHTNELIRESMEYVINVPSESMVEMVDRIGITSGKKMNKFETYGLTPVPASVVGAPLIQECMVNIECKVKDIQNYGSHDIFVGEIAAVHIDEEAIREDGRPDLDKIRPYSFPLGEYRGMGGYLGTEGYSKKLIQE
jgi:Conserved protein/domain typically associated with flavoprotein oxygenases, DIM6/NTAB family